MAHRLAPVILQFSAAETAWAVTEVSTAKRTGFAEAVSVAILIFDAQ